MLKLKLQYFGHLRRRVDSLEKTLMQEKKALSSRGRGRLRGFLELRRPWGFSPEARRGSQSPAGFHNVGRCSGKDTRCGGLGLWCCLGLRHASASEGQGNLLLPQPAGSLAQHTYWLNWNLYHRVSDAIQPSHPPLSPSPPAPIPGALPQRRVVWMWFGAFPGAFGLGRAQPQRRGTSP